MDVAKDTLSLAHEALRAKEFVRAESLASDVLLDNPTNPAALCIVASAHDDRGDISEALRLFTRAIACDPGFERAYDALTRRYYALGREQDGANIYRAWIKVAPDDPEVQHMAAAFTGADVPSKCSESYVRVYFDKFSKTFDDVLVKKLAYRGPEVVAALLGEHIAGTSGLTILDAGCGTGLCGPTLRPFCTRLVGVDLSGEMLERARARGCYDDLVISEITEFMQRHQKTFDVIVTSDVLVYIGDLKAITAATYRALKPGGLFVATVEALEDAGDDGYQLRSSGRYAHRAEYIQRILQSTCLITLAMRNERLRSEFGKNVPFYSVLARKPED